MSACRSILLLGIPRSMRATPAPTGGRKSSPKRSAFCRSCSRYFSEAPAASPDPTCFRSSLGTPTEILPASIPARSPTANNPLCRRGSSRAWLSDSVPHLPFKVGARQILQQQFEIRREQVRFCFKANNSCLRTRSQSAIHPVLLRHCLRR